jgi:hypothetical protein
MKIICPTQIDSITSFKAASGNHYTSMRGEPFEVPDVADAESLLANKRLKKVGLFAPSSAPLKDVLAAEKKELKEWLDKIPGLSEKGEKAMAKAYASKKLLFDAYAAGNNLGELSEKDGDAVIRIINQEMEAE